MTAACSRCAASFLYIAAVSCLLLTPLALGQQKAGQSPQGIQQSTGTITVSVRLQDGSPFDRSLLVNLYTFTGASAGMGGMRGGQAVFANLPLGRYTLEVIAPGYEKLSQPVEITMGGQHEQVFVTLTPEFAPITDSVPSASPILAPNAPDGLT
jgi:hypothetical protein